MEDMNNERKPIKGKMVLVSTRLNGSYFEREFLCMDGEAYVCKTEDAGGICYYPWPYCKPIPKEPRVCYREEYLSGTMSCVCSDKPHVGKYIKFVEAIEDD